MADEERQPTPRGMVRIVHPEVGYADVMPESVEAWEDSGWTVEESEADVAEVETNSGDDPDDQEVR